MLMCFVDHATKIIRSTIMMKGRKELHPVVSPSSISSKLCERHALQHCDSEVSETGEFADSGQECALWRKGAYVQFIKNLSLDSHAHPSTFGGAPLICSGIDDFGGTMRTFRLVAGRGIREPLTTVDR